MTRGCSDVRSRLVTHVVCCCFPRNRLARRVRGIWRWNATNNLVDLAREARTISSGSIGRFSLIVSCHFLGAIFRLCTVLLPWGCYREHVFKVKAAHACVLMIKIWSTSVVLLFILKPRMRFLGFILNCLWVCEWLAFNDFSMSPLSLSQWILFNPPEQ